MKLLIKLGKNFTLLPLFFQVFALACSLMFVVAAYGFVTESFREARIFLYSGLTGFFVFALLNLAISNRVLKETGLMQIISLILLFLLLPLFLALPAWIISPSIKFLDAYVDMVGAFTTTGLPVFEQDILTNSIHLWRSLIAWYGGGLILIAAFVILIPANSGGFDIFSNKNINSNLSRKPTLDERSLTLSRITRRLIPTYIGLTFILWCLLSGLGADGYTSLLRAFSILSTSGISGAEKFKLDGTGFYGELVVAIFLLLAFSHNFFYSLNKKKSSRTLLFDQEVRLGLLTVFCVTLILSLKEINLIKSLFSTDESLIVGLKLIWGNFFTALSFITTTGHVSFFWEETVSLADVPHISIILLGLCLFGGGLATTAGGIKLLRISILFSAFSNETGKLLNPSSIPVVNVKLKSLKMSVFMAWIFFMLFIVSLALVTIILAIFGLFFEEAIVIAVACLTTTGPIIAVLGLDASLISDLSLLPKFVLVISMVLGRLEILVALSVIISALKRA